MSKKWADLPERGSFGAMLIGIRILNWFGYGAGLLVCFFSVSYFFITGSRSRRASRQYLEQLHLSAPQSHPKPNLWRIFLHHWHFGLNVVDRAWFWRGNLDKFTFTNEGKEYLLKPSEKGMLLVGAHFGSFDAMRAFSHDKGLKLNVVMHRAHAQNINALFARLNPDADVKVIELDGADVNEIFALKEKVDQGEIVALLADRPAPYGSQRLSEVNFLGGRAGFPQNPWILASLLECPVYTAIGVRVGLRHYHFQVKPVAEKIELPRRQRQERIQSYINDYVKRLEQLCLDYPYQWFNFYNFWDEYREEAA